MLTSSRGGAALRDVSDVTVIPVIPIAVTSRDDADAAREATHDRAKLPLDFVGGIDKMKVRFAHLFLQGSRVASRIVRTRVVS